MNRLDELRLLVSMSKGAGQPTDVGLLAELKLEEIRQNPVSMKPVKQPPQKPAETNIVPPQDELIQRTVNALSKTKSTGNGKSLAAELQSSEVEGLKRSVADIVQRLGTLSWGGGGTGVVRIADTDDFDKSSFGEGRFLKFSQGMFRLADINVQPQVTYNTTEITSNTYIVSNTDFYMGVTHAGPVTITIPVVATAGRSLVIKDETGNCSNNPITVVGTVDNDAGGSVLSINNGALQLLYRNGWRVY